MTNTVTVQLSGPDFMTSAVEVSRQVGVGTISELQVYPGEGSPKLPTLKPALIHLRNYFAPKAVVALYVDQSLVTNAMREDLSRSCGEPVVYATRGGQLGSGSVAAMAAMFQMQANDLQNAQSIFTQVQADSQKQQMQRWKILQDTQTKIFEIQQDVTVNKAKTADKAFSAMDGYIRG